MLHWPSWLFTTFVVVNDLSIVARILRTSTILGVFCLFFFSSVSTKIKLCSFLSNQKLFFFLLFSSWKGFPFHLAFVGRGFSNSCYVCFALWKMMHPRCLLLHSCALVVFRLTSFLALVELWGGGHQQGSAKREVTSSNWNLYCWRSGSSFQACKLLGQQESEDYYFLYWKKTTDQKHPTFFFCK